MVGLCGVIGESETILEQLISSITITGGEDTCSFKDGHVQIGYVDHPEIFLDQPLDLSDGSLLWVWGTIVGHEHAGEYQEKPTGKSTGEFCANLYEDYGREFVRGLNSEFAGILYHPGEDTVEIFTDRLGSRPVYYTTSDDGNLVFSPFIKSLQLHPNVTLSVDQTLAAVFLRFGRTFGVTTPINGVRSLHPGSITTICASGEIIDEDIYWQPTSTNKNKLNDTFLENCDRILETVVAERDPGIDSTGLLLSGGTDSRLLLDILGENVTAYHMNEQLDENPEARVARNVAKAANVDFVFLRRELDYYPDLLEQVPQYSNYNGRFDHMHCVGFSERLLDEVSYLFTGQYADTIFGRYYTTRSEFPNPYLKHLIPYRKVMNIDNLDSLFDVCLTGPISGGNGWPPFVNDTFDPKELLKDNFRFNTDIEFFGVDYPDVETLAYHGMCYPLTNTYSFGFLETLIHTMPVHVPFIDNRIIDIAQSLPNKILTTDIVPRILAQRDSPLSRIPHPETGLPPTYPHAIGFYHQKLSSAVNLVREKLSTRDEDDISRVDGEGPWPDFAELIRMHPFIEQEIDRQEICYRAIECVEPELVVETLRSHKAGENYWRELFTLVTLCNGPVALHETASPIARAE